MQQIDRPSPALAGPGMAVAVRRAFFATRPAFLTASAMPVLVGAAWAGAALHRFNGLLFGLALAVTVLAHAAANVYNDVTDDLNGTDPGNTNLIYPYTGGSRFIQTGLLSRGQMTRLAIGLGLAALLLGALLAVLRGPGVILLGCAGLGIGLLYSLPGVQLSARGLGEAAIAAGFGILPGLGVVWLQAGYADLDALLICVPMSAWVTAILVIVRWGARGARWIYGSLTVIALAAAAAAIARHALPLWYAAPAVALAGLGLRAARGISSDQALRPRLKQSIELTLAIHALGCVAMIAAILLKLID
jgi:1,4-dihydroxy-2-naphthoate octaprenyltransferase